jgi:uncharacterized protein YecE (DUF72 family)
MGWGYDFWVGNLYPKEACPGDYLKEYSKHFRTVEVDSTFYGIPPSEMVEGWRKTTPEGFTFSAKFPQKITQDKMLSGVEGETRAFMDEISLLGEKRGPLVIQLSYDFRMEDLHLLEKFLGALPKGRYVVEPRHRSLFDGKFYSFLRDRGVCLALVDHPFVPKVQEVTADFAYIRLEGDRRKVKGTTGEVEIDRSADLRQWAEKARRFHEMVNDVFIYCSKFYSGHSPTDAKLLLKFLDVE